MLASAFALLFCGAAAAHDTWISLRVGNEWVYGVTRRMENLLPDGRHPRSRQEGVLDARVTAASPLGPGIFVVEEQRRWPGTQASASAGRSKPGPEDIRVLTSARSGAFLEHAVDYGQGLERYATPLITIPATLHAGMHWAVGTLEQSGLRIEVAGTLLGLQDAKTPAGVFPRCLKIRYEGPVAGAWVKGAQTLPVQSGRYESIRWYARGVGEVLAEETLETRVLTARGILTNRLVERRSLERYRLAHGGTPGPLPAALR